MYCFDLATLGFVRTQMLYEAKIHSLYLNIFKSIAYFNLHLAEEMFYLQAIVKDTEQSIKQPEEVAIIITDTL